MSWLRGCLAVAALALGGLWGFSSAAWAQPGEILKRKAARAALEQQMPFAPQEIAITEHLGEKVTLDGIQLRDETGQEVPLSRFFSGRKPVLLSLVYYNCPSLCNLVLNGLSQTLKQLDWVPGEQFEIVTVSIKPEEGAELATQKKASYVRDLGPERARASQGWHFLTGREEEIRKLAGQVGFGYRWDPRTEEYAHSAALFILTPNGTISRYLYGIEYSVKDLKLSLLEASGGKIGTVIDRFLLFCYRYDATTRKYSVYLTRLVQVSSLATIVLLALVLLYFWMGPQSGGTQRKSGAPVEG
jgi:protein SCO1/2